MNIKYVLIIVLLGFVVLGLVAGTSSTQSNNVPYTASSLDMHNVNAQIFGNKNVTNGIPSYLTNQSKNGTMPDSMLITVRAPGNSTFSLELKNSTGITSYAQNSVSVYLHNYKFVNETTQYFTIKPSSNETHIKEYPYPDYSVLIYFSIYSYKFSI